MSIKFRDDEITSIDNNITMIQLKPTVHITYLGEKACNHLCVEAISNSADEGLNKENPFKDKRIYITYYEETGLIEVGDNGRGIPFPKLLEACTILQAGSKHSRDSGTASAGENGVGMTAMNALSEHFEIISYRGDSMKVLKFKEGKLISDQETKIKKPVYGLFIKMIPSTKFLGETAKINIEALQHWVEKMSYIYPEVITIEFKTFMKDEKKNVSKMYKNKTGLQGYLAQFASEAKVFKNPIVLTDHSTVVEADGRAYDKETGEIKIVDMTRTVELSVAMNYEELGNSFQVESFCNMVNTSNHGSHVTGVRSAYVPYIRKQVKASFTKKEEKLDVLDNDILNGLNMVVNLYTTYAPGFAPQSKETVANPELVGICRKAASKMFDEFFKSVDGRRYLQVIIGVVKNNIEMRMKVNKTKSKVKGNVSFLDEYSIPGYHPASNMEKGAYRELYIVEGKSAGGGAKVGRYDNKIQGILELKGKFSNVLKKPLHEILQNEDIKKILAALKCGYGKNFNIEDLHYTKIIILTDSDVDGDHIAGLLLTLFMTLMPQLVLNGHVYRAAIPLYSLKTNNKKFSVDHYRFSKADFFKSYAASVAKNLALKPVDGDTFLESSVLERLVAVGTEYYGALGRLAKHYRCHRDIVEYIAMNIDTFKETIGDLDGGLRCEGNRILGEYDRCCLTNLSLSEVFMRNVRELVDYLTLLRVGTHFEVYIMNTDGVPVLDGVKTVGQLMEQVDGYEPAVGTRFKGLGEIQPEELGPLAFDPSIRRLVRLTTNDFEKAIGTFASLFGSDGIAERKEILTNIKITVEELDN